MDHHLDSAILSIESGNFLVLIEGEGKDRLLAWLRELRETREKSEERARADLMESLTGFWYLTQEEAEKVCQSLTDKKTIEYEIGPCRHCGGKGHKETSEMGCFGPSRFGSEQCFTCSGTGTDKKRIKVPA